MNDRFKFRVWNNCDCSKDFGKVYYDAEETYDYLGGTPQIPATSFDVLLEDDEWIVEQCTSIKDKNGKLIYEGDIVTDGADIFEVVWDYNAWCIQTNKFQYFLTEGFELIGNIHTDKNLLE